MTKDFKTQMKDIQRKHEDEKQRLQKELEKERRNLKEQRKNIEKEVSVIALLTNKLGDFSLFISSLPSVPTPFAGTKADAPVVRDRTEEADAGDVCHVEQDR